MPQQSKMAKRAAVIAAMTTTAQSFIVGCGSRIMDERIDPLINPGAPSGHAHAVMGGNGMDFNVTTDEVYRATCSSCEIKEDLSIYWTPKLYYRNSTNGQFTAVPQLGDTIPTGSGQLSGQKSYYLLRRGRDNDEALTAFPKGFRMIAGDPLKRNYTGDNDYAAKAISFACLGSNQPETHGLPNYNCPDGMRAQVFFPQCWSGKDVAPPGFKSHVAYPNKNDPRGSDYNGGYCTTPEFPVHLPSLFFEVFYDVNRYKDAWYDGKMPFVFAQGDPTGYGFHGDFINGWDVGKLQQAVNLNNGCDSGAGDAAGCQYFTTFTGDQQDQCKIPPQIAEDVYGPFSQLPGCNPVQSGPAYATNYAGAGCTRTGTIGPYKTYYKDLTQTLGWKYIGCTPDNGNDRTYNSGLNYNSTETIEMCIGFCKQRGYSIAGLEYGSQCYCGNNQRADRVPIQSQGNCNMPCAGDSTELCGGPNALSTYQLCTSTADCKNSAYQHV